MSEFTDTKGRKIAGYAVLIVGFLMIVANALDYLLGWGAGLFPLMIIGLALVVVGTGLYTRH